MKNGGFAYFNPRTPCGVRHYTRKKTRQHIRISIHAPLAGCDDRCNLLDSVFGISIHAPLAGCDLRRRRALGRILRFQSTHPLRGATRAAEEKIPLYEISIHAPLAGCDVL